MAIARVASNTWLNSGNPPGTSATASKAFAVNVTAGSCLVCVSYNTATDDTVTITDNNGNSWTSAAIARYQSALGIKVAISYALNANAGATTVTFTGGNSSAYRFIAICEYTGVATSSALDGSAVSADNATGSASTVNPGSITTTGDAVVIAASTNSPTTDDLTVSGSFVDQYSAVPTNFYLNAIQDALTTGAGSKATSWGGGLPGKNYWNAVALALKSASGGASVAPIAAYYNSLRANS